MSASRSDRTGQESVVLKMLRAIRETESDDSESDGDENGEEGDKKIRAYRERMKKRKKNMEDLGNKFLEDSKRRKPTITVEKKVTRVEDLPAANTLALDKQISLINYLRDVIFKGLKYVTKEVIESGTIVGMILDNLQLVSEYQKRAYQLHLELALKKKIGQFRNNSIKNMKWKYRNEQGKGEGTLDKIVAAKMFVIRL
jgi:hypothetical protein